MLPPARVENPIIQGASGRVLRRSLPIVGKISPILKAVLESPLQARWLAQLVKRLPRAQVMILDPQDQIPH